MSTGSGEPPVRRRRGRPGYDQETILRTAVELFNRKGYDATSMGDLAKELGLTKPAIYHHVTSKEQLLSLALDDALDELTALVTEASHERAGTSAYERLRHVVRRSVEVLVAHQPSVTLLLRVRGNSPVEQAALERRRWLDDRLAALVADAVKEGALRDDVPPALVSRLLFGMVNSLVEWYRADGAYDTATVARTLTTMAFDGLARHEPPAP
ncbi:TetR family transcriptional regulator [Actinomadura hallensis]|uniref:TetR family transcriptional regulator n=1 Tax=Actinomadura hallensis TaxID=337895 RepID=A0A543I8L3_9ACTN|nr:TetR/AcrR family transcriptional regulator [Actinomadura hallensis]TQM66944.1 TetR family transcriptional regulator [Actinomadura hallensis]HLV72362.1 TetR/AcrR family transcriptional regulator [Vulgatibacteraceae bacterium]